MIYFVKINREPICHWHLVTQQPDLHILCTTDLIQAFPDFRGVFPLEFAAEYDGVFGRRLILFQLNFRYRNNYW